MRKQAELIPEEVVEDIVENNEEETQPIQMHIFRRAFDYVANIEPPKGLAYRELIRDKVMLADMPKMDRKETFKFLLLKLSEANPLLFLSGVICWMYLVILTILKLTILV